jgi:hypothetical protein
MVCVDKICVPWFLMLLRGVQFKVCCCFGVLFCASVCAECGVFTDSFLRLKLLSSGVFCSCVCATCVSSDRQTVSIRYRHLLFIL